VVDREKSRQNARHLPPVVIPLQKIIKSTSSGDFLHGPENILIPPLIRDTFLAKVIFSLAGYNSGIPARFWSSGEIIPELGDRSLVSN